MGRATPPADVAPPAVAALPRRVLVAIPAWNEEPNLEIVVGELRAIRPVDDIVVVNDGSSDRTAEVARALGCRIVNLPFQLGYGAALQAGIKYGLRRGYDVVVTFDADGQHDPSDIQALVDAVQGGNDLALGSRVLCDGSYQGSVARRLGRALFARLARFFTGLDLTDPTSGLKAFGPRGQELFALARFPDRFPDADALVLASRARLSLGERPARMRPSRNRHSLHGGGLRACTYTLNMLFSLFVAAIGRPDDLRG
jgi:glycosyltransferase involved in cell wall biosynthesis